MLAVTPRNWLMMPGIFQPPQQECETSSTMRET
jgi:hypothetical protein